MTEPSYEELKARLSELEKQVETKKRSGSMEFRVSEKGGVSVTASAGFPLPFITSSGHAFLMPLKLFDNFLKKTKES